MARILAVLVVALVAAAAAPASAHADPPASFRFDRVRMVPVGDTTIGFQDRSYGGDVTVRAAPDGLVVIEQTTVEGYLAGILEVPFSWPQEALAAQVVASRSYLAATLAAGRAGAGARYGFDICASSACQVYAGTGYIEGPGGDRWLEAVQSTAGEILVYGGVPARTFFHSTSGGRTEAIQDVWAGSDPVPYLVGAPSPGEPSPFASWRFEVPADAFVDLFAEAGYGVGGEIEEVRVEPTSPGEGVWTAIIATADGTIEVDVGEVRAVLNRYGPRLHPDLLPGIRPSGRRYPQSGMSYRFDLAVHRPRADIADGPVGDLLPEEDLPPHQAVIVSGRGWGHHIGMSQYGAMRLAEAGAGYDEILAHFYGGLLPVAAPDLLPDSVEVGLGWERTDVTMVVPGPFVLIAGDDDLVLNVPGGEWRFLHTADGRVGVVPPASYLLDLLQRLTVNLPFL